MAESGTPGKAKWERPFQGMRIDDNKVLGTVERSFCLKCKKSRKFFCYTCLVVLPGLEDMVPQIRLPVKIDIIKHKNEIDGKTTAVHATLIASEDVSIHNYPDIPNYYEMEGVVLVFPSSKSVNVSSLFNGNFQLENKDNFGLPKGFHMGTLLQCRLNEVEKELDETENLEDDSKDIMDRKTYSLENLPVKRAVLIDSTWSQCRAIFKDPRICNLKAVVLQNRISRFWRHQKGGSSKWWYLATIEALHQFLLEIHFNAFGVNLNYSGLEAIKSCIEFLPKFKLINQIIEEKDHLNLVLPYCGQYDNLLFFFSYFYDLIHKHYEHDTLKAYRRPFV